MNNPVTVQSLLATVQQPTSSAYQFSAPSASDMEAMAQQLLSSITQGLLSVLEGFVSPGSDPLTELSSWADDIPFIGPLIEGLGGSGSGIGGLISTLEGLGGDVEDVISELTGGGGLLSGFVSDIPILGQLISAGGGSGSLLSDFTGLFNVNNIEGLLDPGSGNILSSLFSIPEGMLSSIGIGSLTTASPNLLPTPAFTPGALAPSPDWSLDPSTGPADGTGSVTITADGNFHALDSGVDPSDTIAIGAGQTVTAAISVINQGYAGIGTPSPPAPFQLQVVPFTAAGRGAPYTVASYTPTTDVTDWADAVIVSGTYPVPTGVTAAQLRLYMTSTAQLGVFHFGSPSFTQAATAPQSFITDLEGDLSTLQNLWQSLADTIASTVSGIPVIGAGLAEVAEALGSITPDSIVGSLGSINLVGDVTGIIGHLIDAFTGQPAGTTTNGSLANLYNTVNQAINNTSNEDETTFYDTTTTVPIQTWATQIDLVGVGAGQAGENGVTLEIDGQGGQAGKSNMTTLMRGTHYDSGTPHITVTVNTDGSITLGVPAGTSTAAHSITCAIGSGTQSAKFGTGYMGIGPGPINYNNKTYAGGGNQNTGGAPGIGPGGGGAGGVGLILPAGGPGAPGGGWVRQLATAITGASTGADITAPSNPTVTFDSATNTSITLTPSGGADA